MKRTRKESIAVALCCAALAIFFAFALVSWLDSLAVDKFCRVASPPPSLCPDFVGGAR